MRWEAFFFTFRNDRERARGHRIVANCLYCLRASEIVEIDAQRSHSWGYTCKLRQFRFCQHCPPAATSVMSTEGSPRREPLVAVAPAAQLHV
jgi:hypothetical protein